MNKTFKKYLFLALAALFLLVAAFFEYDFLKEHPEKSLLKRFQKDFYLKE